MPSPDVEATATWAEGSQAFDEWVEFLSRRDADPEHPLEAAYSRALAEQIRAEPLVDVLIREAFIAGYWSGQTAPEQPEHG